jgi:hypothetical protein
MASLNREAVYTALKNTLAATQGFKTVTREWVPWEQLKDINQPALVLVEKNEKADPKPGRPTTWHLDVDLILYVRVDHNNDATPTLATLNALIQAVDQALQADPATMRQTLGGAVYHAAINGTIAKDQGMLDDQALAIIPVQILTYA